jgi:hypothetical protein
MRRELIFKNCKSSSKHQFESNIQLIKDIKMPVLGYYKDKNGTCKSCIHLLFYSSSKLTEMSPHLLRGLQNLQNQTSRPASYSGNSEFKFRPRNGISWMRSFLILFSPSRQMIGQHVTVTGWHHTWHPVHCDHDLFWFPISVPIIPDSPTIALWK